MAKNDFVPFGTDPNANVQDQGGWEANQIRRDGFYSGWTKSFELNKAIRQATFPSASISEWVNQVLLTVPMRDNGNEQEWVNNFDAAIRSRIREMINNMPAPVRYRPHGAITVYVDSNYGFDSNSGLAPDNPFRTIQHAVDYMLSNVDLGPNQATISCNTGTYNESIQISGSLMGQKGIQYWQFVTTNGPVFVRGVGYTFAVFGGAQFFFNGDWHVSCQWAPYGPNAVVGGYNCRFGTYGGGLSFGHSPGCDHVSMAPGGEFTCQVPADYRIAGDGQTHWHCDSGGRIIVTDKNISIDTVSNFATYFAQASDCGVILPIRNNFPGSGNVVVGAGKYLANVNGVINTAGGGVGALPGNLPGATGSGGQYV